MIFNADHKNDIQLRHNITPITITITENIVVVVVTMMTMMGETMTTHMNRFTLLCNHLGIFFSFFNLRGYLLLYKNQMFSDNEQTSTCQT